MATQKKGDKSKDSEKVPTERKARVEKTESEKTDAFIENAPKRVDRVLKAIFGLSKLARPASYIWNEKQIEKIIATLGSSFEDMENRFRHPEKKHKSQGFTF